MRYLWITWSDPKPERDGQRIYSGGMINAVASAGAEIDVLCFANEGSDRHDGLVEGNVRWQTVPRASRPSWASALSPLPNVAYRCNTGEKRRRLTELLRRQDWDAIVLDGLPAAWSLPFIEQCRIRGRKSPRLIYIAHNHEASIRKGMAKDYRGNPLTRGLLHYDAEKARRAENRILARADLVTAITPEDAARFTAQCPADKPVIVLPPGYGGGRVQRRTITADLPRRVVLVGSFDWFAKRMNLERFIEVADPLFAAAGAQLTVVGAGEPAFLDGLRQRVHATRLVGAVDSVEPYFADARIAVVPERSGGGFKLKVLDYVFNRLPVAALHGSVAGTPLHAPESILTYAGFEDLARGVVDSIDDLPLLNSLQERAFDACINRFDWRERGERFIAQTVAA